MDAVLKKLLLLFLLVFPLSAANVVWTNAGTDETFDLSFFNTTAGTVTSATDQVNTGPRSIKVALGSPAAAGGANRSGVCADAGRRISFWFRYDTTPATGNASFAAVTQSNGSTSVLTISLTTSNTVTFTGTGATAVTGSTTLSTNTWNRITMSYSITNTTTYSYKVYVNGTLQGTANAGTLTNVTSDTFRFIAGTAWGTNANVWYDDLYIDDGSDGSDPGAVIVTAKRPNANGSINNFNSTTSTTNSGYGTGNSIYVNERPLATTGARVKTTTGTADENFAIEGSSTGDVSVNGTILGWLSWAHISGVSTDALYDNGSTFVPGTVVSSTAGIRWHATTSASYPSCTACVGANRPSSNATDCVLNEAGMSIAYIPAPPGSAPHRLLTLGIGMILPFLK